MVVPAQAISRGITKSGVGVQTLNLEQCRCGIGTVPQSASVSQSRLAASTHMSCCTMAAV